MEKRFVIIIVSLIILSGFYNFEETSVEGNLVASVSGANNNAINTNLTRKDTSVFVIGQPHWEYNVSNLEDAYRGKAYVLASETTNFLWDEVGEYPRILTDGDEFGNSATILKDINGDGFDDIIIGSKNFNMSALSGSNASMAGSYWWFAGKIYAYSGKDGSQLWDKDGIQGHFYFNGFGNDLLRNVGDVNGDSFDDIVVGHAWGYGFYSGKTGSKIREFNYTGTYAEIRAGDGVGDVNGDGYNDVVIGGVGPLGTNLSGEVFVVSGKDGTVIWSKLGSFDRHFFGNKRVRYIGDVDYDGIGDIAVASLQGFGPGIPNSSITILSGVDGSKLWNKTQGNNFGEEIIYVGDLDRDGAGDFAVFGGEDDPTISMFSGVNGSVIWKIFGNTTLGNSSTYESFDNIGCIDDQDGDGMQDILTNFKEGYLNIPSVRILSSSDGSVLKSIYPSDVGNNYNSSGPGVMGFGYIVEGLCRKDF